MAITIKDGNVLNAEEHIIAHQVNGLGIMGGGVAKAVRQNYPLVFKTYAHFVKQHPTPESLLGQNLMVTDDGSDLCGFSPDSTGKIISNLFGQARIGTTVKQTDEIALRRALVHLREFALYKNLSIAMPYGIGCGLGGGDWGEVYAMIQDVFRDFPNPVTLYRYGA